MRFSPEISQDISGLEKLIHQGEGVRLDFKQTISDQRKIARTISAFANNKGGILLVGVKDNGELMGCDAEEEMYMLFEAAEHFCEPPVDIYFTLYEIDEDCTIVQAAIKNSLKKPHFSLDDKDDWHMYIRTNDKTMLASSLSVKMIENEHETSNRDELDSKQKFVLEYLTLKESITPKILAAKLNISLQRSNRILIQLLQLGFILHHKDARGDYYSIR